MEMWRVLLMFIGRIGTQPTNIISRMIQGTNRSVKTMQSHINASQQSQKRDTVEISATARSRSRSLQMLQNNCGTKTTAMTQIHLGSYEVLDQSDLGLDKRLIFGAEKDYTEGDALWRQYVKDKGYRLHAYIDENGDVQSEGTVRLILRSNVSDEELEAFRKELVEKGLDDAIDWYGVKEDLSASIDLSDDQNVDMIVDNISARYAVLKDKIMSQFSGTEQEEQMNILNDLYDRTKEELANSYAKEVGGILEGFGEDIKQNLKKSFESAINQRISQYEDYLEQVGDNYAQISNSEDSWLYKDDAFMAAQLRKKMQTAEIKNEQPVNNTTESTYNYEELKHIRDYAITLNDTFHSYSAYNASDDSFLGEKLANIYKNSLSNSSDSVNKIINNTFEPFMDKLMDKLDKLIEKNGEENKKHYIWGRRTKYIDREEVYSTFYHLIGKELN